MRDAQTYESWYRRPHVSPHLLERAVYGLPELVPGVAEAELVANPGCFPSAILLAVMSDDFGNLRGVDLPGGDVRFPPLTELWCCVGPLPLKSSAGLTFVAGSAAFRDRADA